MAGALIARRQFPKRLAVMLHAGRFTRNRSAQLPKWPWRITKARRSSLWTTNSRWGMDSTPEP